MKKTTESNARADFRGMQENYKNLLKAKHCQRQLRKHSYSVKKKRKSNRLPLDRQGDKKEKITEIIIRKAIRRMENEAADKLG